MPGDLPGVETRDRPTDLVCQIFAAVARSLRVTHARTHTYTASSTVAAACGWQWAVSCRHSRSTLPVYRESNLHPRLVPLPDLHQHSHEQTACVSLGEETAD